MSVVTPMARTQSIAFLSSGAKEANDALESLTALYGNSPFDEADVIVALGGDGLMLQTLHLTMKAPKPIYGMNRGSVRPCYCTVNYTVQQHSISRSKLIRV